MHVRSISRAHGGRVKAGISWLSSERLSSLTVAAYGLIPHMPHIETSESSAKRH